MEVRGRGVGSASSSASPPPTPGTTAPQPTGSKATAHKPPKASGVRASITPVSVRQAVKTSSTARETTVVNAASLKVPRQSVLELSLVENLKKQIAFLEAQVVCLKRQQDSKALATQTTARGAPVRASPSSSQHKDPATLAPEPRTAGGFAGVPEPYQTELVSLQLNLERVLADYDAVQTQNHHLDKEKCVMAAELAELRAELRAAQQHASIVEAEKAAALEALSAEQAGRRLLEETLAQGMAGAGKAPELLDMRHQRDYFKVQVDRLRAQEGVLTAKAGALEAAVGEERAHSKALEAELCAALDRVGELEAREERMRSFHAKLGGRYITTAAMLRKVLEAAKTSGASASPATGSASVVAEVEASVAGGAEGVRSALADAEGFAQELLATGANEATAEATEKEKEKKETEEKQEEPPVPTAEEVLPAVAVPPPPPPVAVPPPPPAGVVPPPPPAAAVPPPPPTASVPAPPPPPPPVAAAVPAPPEPSAALLVPEPPAATDAPASAPAPPASALQGALAQLEAQIAAEEAALAAFVESNGGSVGSA